MLRDTLGNAQDNAITNDNTYPYWKIRFELDQSNPGEYNSWYNIEDIDNEANLTDETTTDDVIGDDTSTFWFDDKGTTAAQTATR